MSKKLMLHIRFNTVLSRKKFSIFWWITQFWRQGIKRFPESSWNFIPVYDGTLLDYLSLVSYPNQAFSNCPQKKHANLSFSPIRYHPHQQLSMCFYCYFLYDYYSHLLRMEMNYHIRRFCCKSSNRIIIIFLILASDHTLSPYRFYLDSWCGCTLILSSRSSICISIR